MDPYRDAGGDNVRVNQPAAAPSLSQMYQGTGDGPITISYSGQIIKISKCDPGVRVLDVSL